MKITLIRPSIAGVQMADALRPLGLIKLFSLTPKGIDVEFYDEYVEILPSVIDSDVVCFAVETFSAKRAYLLSRKYKRYNLDLKSIMFGLHPSACPDEAGVYADCVIIGDAEPVWVKVVDDLQSNTLKARYISSSSYMLPSARVDKSVLSSKEYLGISVIQLRRGCSFDYSFCSMHSLYTSCAPELETGDIMSSTINEIKDTNEKLLFITGDIALQNKAKLKEFLEKLKPLKKKWICRASLSIAEDDEMLKLMSKSGCIAMIIRFDGNYGCSGLIKKIYSRGIMIYANFMFGYPADTLDSFIDAYEFAMKHKFLAASFDPLVAMPGTDMYDKLKSEGRLIHDEWWLSETYRFWDAIHCSENLTASQLTESCGMLRRSFYSSKNMAKRMTNPVNVLHLPVFLQLNDILAFEMQEKRLFELGGGIL